MQQPTQPSQEPTSPEPSPSEPASDLTPEPEPTTTELDPVPSTSESTETPQEPQIVVLEGEQFGGITVGLVLLLFFSAANLIASMRRP